MLLSASVFCRRGRGLELDHAVLDRRRLARLGVAGLGGKEVGLHSLRHRARVGVGVDGHEEVGALLVGEIGAVAQRHEDISRSRLSTTLMPSPLSSIMRATRRVTSSTTSFSWTPVGPVAPGVMPAMPGVEHDEAQRLSGGPARRALRASRPPWGGKGRARCERDPGARSPSPGRRRPRGRCGARRRRWRAPAGAPSPAHRRSLARCGPASRSPGSRMRISLRSALSSTMA